MTNKIRVVQISESEFSVKGHGVHTAYLETINGLKNLPGVEVSTNSFQPADVRHIHTVGIYSLIHLLLLGGLKVVSAHVVPASFVGSLIGAKYWLGLAKRYLVWFYNRADLVIAVSDETKMALEELGVKSPIKVIYNMVDTSRYRQPSADLAALRKRFDIAEDSFVVIGNGQVQPRKRVDTFINLAKQFPDMQFIWVGGTPFKMLGADHNRMQQLIDGAPGNLHFSGVVSLEGVREYLSIGDVFIMTSDQETFGLAIVEAAASGLPIILRDLPDYDNTFRDYALMADEAGFAEALRRVAYDSKLRRELVGQAKQLAERFDSQTISKQIVAEYDSALKAKNATIKSK